MCLLLRTGLGPKILTNPKDTRTETACKGKQEHCKVSFPISGDCLERGCGTHAKISSMLEFNKNQFGI